MGPWNSSGCSHRLPRNRLPAALSTLLILLFTSFFPFAVASHCKVDLCSRQYARDVEAENIPRGPSYHFCTVLRSYSDCIRATARSCRGNLEYHSISSLVMQWYGEYNCTYIIAQGPPDPHQAVPSGRPTHRPSRPTSGNQCMLRSRGTGPVSFTHCGLFGDPHLRTFYDEFQTCRVLGAWPLVDNPFLAVQVTNDAVLKGASATATSKVTIIVREHAPCTEEKTYEAQVDYLPGVFVDGSKSSGPDHVWIQEEDPGRHVEITLRHIATRIIVRQVGRFLTFAVRMPREVAGLGENGEALQLCVRGCPRRERIDYSQFLANPDHWISVVTNGTRTAVPLVDAVNTCRHHNVTDFYFDACVFDLLTTGDSSFSQAAREAMKDVLVLNPAAAGSRENRTYLLTSPAAPRAPRPIASSASGRHSLPNRLALFLFLLVLMRTTLWQT